MSKIGEDTNRGFIASMAARENVMGGIIENKGNSESIECQRRGEKQ